MKKAEFGLIGLAVMGENLAMNILRRGFRLAVYNRETDWVRAFTEGRAAGMDVIGTYSPEELVACLEPPRRIMLLIRASAVDEMLDRLIPLLSEGDIVIDGGNSNFRDTMRRCERMRSLGFEYLGCGVSGGEEGALKGPSLMPGGSKRAWEAAAPVLRAIAAKVDGVPCCDYVGENGAGHFVKMVHNGIEYGDMQIICEAYQIMRDLLRMDADAIADVFEKWNGGVLNSYLIGITAQILKKKDADGSPLVDAILDTAGQKGTGKWAAAEALDEGAPLTLIGEAVFMRCLSAMKEERVRASKALTGPEGTDCDRQTLIDALEQALYMAKIVSYAQGYMLMRSAAETYGWELDYGGIALLWRGGCIIRSGFLNRIRDAYARDPALENLLPDSYFRDAVASCQQGLRTVCAKAVCAGVPVPALMSALSFYDAYRCERLPANLLQAQRDFFGAHTYERTDAPRGKFFHTNWNGEGGSTPATTYTV